MIIRREQLADVEAIRDVTEKAFGRSEEANLIEALRAHDKIILSLVAIQAGQIAGHILFCPVVIEAHGSTQAAVGLGPMAVLPQFQGQGIGSSLVRRGLEELRKENYAAVVVLGHPHFYSHFGFVPASRYGITSQYDVPDEVFMVVEIVPGVLEGENGTAVYPSEFNEV